MAETPLPTTGSAAKDRPLIRAVDLARYFDVSPPLLNRLIHRCGRSFLKAVDGVSFEIQKGTTFSVVGESGCGKSTLARLLVGLYPPTRGRIEFDGIDMTACRDPREKRALRRRFQMIFQDTTASLDPRWRVRTIVAEPIRAFGLAKDATRRDQRVAELLTAVGLTPNDREKYPHEFSGGQRQRISIARALSSSPELLVCDEPTSALDVSVQAQILNLMKDLQRRLGLTYLFISHNLAVVSYISDKIAVMYLGRFCEVAGTRELLQTPRHPYTRLLLDTIPDPDMARRTRAPIAGEVPSPIDPPAGCAFHPRCPLANNRCKQERPDLRRYGATWVACHAVEEQRAE
jgi:peptide/nickel transport system ATP-binding protein